jgi:hypothetical protein
MRHVIKGQKLKIFDPVEDVHSTFWLWKIDNSYCQRWYFNFFFGYPKLMSLNFEIRTSKKADVERLAIFYLREKKPSTLTE